MNSARRGTRVMLGLLGVAVFFVVLGGLAGTVPPAIALTAGLAYAAVALAVFAKLGPNFLRNRLQEFGPAVTIANRTTAAGRRAAQRARNRGEFSLETNLLDIGLMVNERRRNGQLDRHLAESISMDASAVQPFVKLHLNPGTAERLALIEFEFYDQSGKVQFSHQQKHWVRDGENLIACEQQLPLRGNDELGRAGTWDLRVKVDGTLAGVHGFSMLPAQDTGRRLAEDDAVEQRRDRMTISSPDEDDAPVSLEELLREQKRRSGSM
ncbi:MAG: hypothetical protein KF716_01990 [Anaerolineae bacterium]|nr:hypothetical protein [Anaerolineae bacterium]